MKKKLIILGCIIVAAVVVFFVAGIIADKNVEITVNRERITIEAGSELSTSPGYYINSTEKVLKNAKVDISGVNVNVVRDGYIVEVTYKNRVFDIFVDVVDTTPPVISVENNTITIGVNTTFKLHELPIKIEDISPTQSMLKNNMEAMHYDTVGEYEDTVTVIDAKGNKSSLDIKIIVADLNPPVISGIHDFTIYQGGAVNPRAGVTATDIEDGDITDKIQISPYNVGQIGTQTITYTVSDDYGNVTTENAKLTVLKIPETTAARR